MGAVRRTWCPPEKLDWHTRMTVSTADNKKEANQGTAQKPVADRRVIGSHTNPVSIMATN